ADRRSLADDQVREARGRLAGYRRRGSGAAATAATTTAATATAAAITGGGGGGRAGVVGRSLYAVPIGRGDGRGAVDRIWAPLARRAVMRRGESRVVFAVRVGQGIVRVDRGGVDHVLSHADLGHFLGAAGLGEEVDVVVGRPVIEKGGFFLAAFTARQGYCED